MKKTIALLITLLMVFSFASCSVLEKYTKTENQPEDVVSAFLDALKNFDAEAMDACYYEVESSDATLSESDIALLSAMYGKVSYEILNVEIDGSKAVVKVKATKADYVAAAEKMRDIMVEKIQAGELVADDLTDDDYMAVLKECLLADDAKMITKELDVKCILVSNKWYLDAEDDSLDAFIDEGMDMTE
ncbi:MAG: DUF4878 domain-containing protein [Clostridia bacterium]|nr:DUF4878 domain-containing protein [Clostridia bacterium]